MSKSRAWTIATILVVACIVAAGLGIGLGLRKKSDDSDSDNDNTANNAPDDQISCPVLPSSSRLTPESPIYTTPTESEEGFYKYGAAASDSPPCSKIASDIMLRQGGSAIDAAIAGLVCAGVYNPQSCGIGGGFMMTYYERATQKKTVIMAREMAPGASTENMYKQDGWNSLEGGKSIAVPGEVRGLYEAWKLGGKLPWSDLFQPSIKMCKEGFTVGQLLENDIENQKRFYANYTELRRNSDGLVGILSGQNDRLEKELQIANQKNQVVSAERDSLREVAQQLKAEKDGAVLEKETMSKCLEQEKVKVKDSEAIASNLKSELDRVYTEYNMKKLENKRFCVSAKKLADEISSLKEEINYLKGEVSKEKENANAWRESCESYERRYLNLRNRLIHIHDTIGSDNEQILEHQEEAELEEAELGEAELGEGEMEESDSESVVYLATRYEEN